MLRGYVPARVALVLATIAALAACTLLTGADDLSVVAAQPSASSCVTDEDCSPHHVLAPSCSNDTCIGECERGYADCNGNKQVDGCEIDLYVDPDHCGACATACSGNNLETRTCTSGTCDGACKPGFADCNGDKRTDGCETNLDADPDHCGDCAVACSGNNIETRACSSGKCGGACAPGFADCNEDKQADGCETDIANDPKNCGGCGEVCPLGGCAAGKCSAYLPTGVQTNVPESSLVDWTKCFTGSYATSGTSLAMAVLSQCSKSNLMLACRATGSPTLSVLAWAPRADVLFDTGTSNTPHDANGVGWYYSSNRSWGFAKQGDAIDRNSCDTGSTNPELRICWHTSSGNLNSGWRCGASTNAGAAFERLIYEAD